MPSSTPRGNGSGRGQLNPREQRFCQEMLIDGNGTQAAIRAGYAPKGAAVQAARLSRKAKVKQELTRLRDAIANEIGATAERTIKQMARLAYGDVRRLCNGDGSFKLPHQWDDDGAAVVSSVEMDVRVVGTGKDREVIPFVKRVRMADRNAATANLARHQGLFSKDTLNLTLDPIRKLMERVNATGGGLKPRPR